MASTTLPVVFSHAGRVAQASTETPLIAALKIEFKAGRNLQAALEELMRSAGLLGEAPTSGFAAEVRAALERLQRAGLIIVDAGQRSIRLTALRDVVKPIILPLEITKTVEAKRGEVGLSIGGAASLQFELSVLRDAQAAALGLHLAATDVLHCCCVQGSLGAHLSIAAGSAGASAAISTGADIDAGIRWYFQRHADDTVVSSLVDAAIELSSGVRPWDLDEVMRVLDEPDTHDGHLDALKAIDVTAERKLAFSGKIALARGFAAEIDAPAPQGEATVAVALQAGASLAYRMQQSGNWQIRLTREQGDTVLALTRARTSEQVREFALGVDIGISGVGELVQAWTDKVLPALDPAIKTAFDKWSQPGTALRALLLHRINADSATEKAVDQLAELLLGQGDAASAAQGLSAALLDRWKADLDERVQSTGQRVEALADQLLAPLLSKAGGTLGAKATGAVQKLLADALDELQRDVDAEIVTLRDNLITRAQDALAAALRPLEQVGERVDSLVNDVNAHAGRIADALKRLLARYENLRKALHKAASDAAALKVALAFGDVASFATGEQSTLRLRFHAANAETRGLLSRLVLGLGDVDYGEIERIASGTNAALSVDAGSFKAFAARSRSITLSLDLFGLHFDDARVLRDDVRIEVDSAGRVGLFSASATQSHTSTTLKETRAARFSADFDLLDPNPGHLPGHLALSFELSDDDLKPKELRQFFDSFVGAGLMQPEVTERARTLVGSRPAANVQIEVGLSGIESALRAAAASFGDAALRRRAFENLMRFDRSKLKHMWVAAPELLFQWAKEADKLGNARAAASKAMEHHNMTQSGGQLQQLASRLEALHRHMDALSATVVALGDIHALATSAAGGNVDAARARQLRGDLDGVLGKVQRAMQPLVAVNDAVMGVFSERLPAHTVALLATLAQLAGPGAMSARPMLRWFTRTASGERLLGPPTLLD